MKANARILVSLACNYDCSYCCNCSLLERFTLVREADWVGIVRGHEAVVISGGEPLIMANIIRTLRLASLVKTWGRRLYVSTNLSVDPPDVLVQMADGWSCSYHAGVDIAAFQRAVQRLIDRGGRSIRVRVAVGGPHFIFVGADTLSYVLGSCEASAPWEDWYLTAPERCDSQST